MGKWDICMKLNQSSSHSYGSVELHYAHMHKRSVVPPKPQDHRPIVTSQTYADKSDFLAFQCAPVHSMEEAHSCCCSSNRKSINV